MNNEKNREILRKLADDALSVQDACNIIPVVTLLQKSTATLAAIASIFEPTNKHFVNRHPVVVLVANKLIDLVGLRNAADIDEALEPEKADTVAVECIALQMEVGTLKGTYRALNPDSLMVPAEYYRQGAVAERLVKIARLCDCLSCLAFSKAYDECEKMKAGEVQLV